MPGDWAKYEPTFPCDEDENPNCIADAWPHNAGEATDDAEAIAGKGHPDYPGDGLSRYEEYRGFIVQGSHTRTDPNTDMDMFLIDEDDLGSGYFEETGLTLHFLALQGEVRVQPLAEQNGVNLNCGYAHVLNQHAVRYANGGYHPDGWYGFAEYIGTPPQAPYYVAVVYIEKIRQDSPPTPSRTTIDPDDADAIDTAIAHELGHRVAIDTSTATGHHVPANGGDDNCIMISEAPFRWGNPRNIYCSELLENGSGACIHKWRLHERRRQE